MLVRGWPDRLGFQASLIIAPVLALPDRVLVGTFPAVDTGEGYSVRATEGVGRNKLIFPVAPGC
jgi:hypothetical protein